jgi:hypothetical protein
MAESDSLRRRNIINGLHASSLQYLVLSNDLWASSVTMESFQPDLENIIVALQSNRSLEKISIRWDVLIAIGESDQRRLFRSVGSLPTLQRMSVWGGTNAIHTRLLADALSETSNGIKFLELSGLKISSRSEVEQLARGLKARVGSLDRLTLEGIVLDVDDRTGYLDPILLALTPVPGEPRGKLSCFRFSCLEAGCNEASAVSPEALGAFFTEEPIEMPRRAFLHLNNLGLNDSHCEAMALELARDDAVLRPIDELDLTGNPSIGQQGYEALLGLLNRRFDIGAVVVEDLYWKTTFDMVVLMNSKYNRGRFLENGVFPSKAMWVNFLAELTKVVRCPPSVRPAPERVTAMVWYTLRENPDWINDVEGGSSSFAHACTIM